MLEEITTYSLEVTLKESLEDLLIEAFYEFLMRTLEVFQRISEETAFSGKNDKFLEELLNIYGGILEAN